MDNTKITLDEQLSKLGVYELRNLAREVGVCSPTTKVRAELISLIKEIITNGNFSQTKQKLGRPAKKLHNSKTLLASIENCENIVDNNIPFLKPMNETCEFVFAQDVQDCSMNGELSQFKGIIRVNTTENGFYVENRFFISSKTFVVLTDYLICRYALKEGDLIEGFCRFADKKDVGIVESITKINNSTTELLKPIKQAPFILPNAYIKDIDINIKLGQTLLEKYNSIDTFVEKNLERFEQFQKQNIIPVILAIGINIESKLKLDLLKNGHVIFTLYDESLDSINEAINDAINHVNSLYNRGEKVCFYVLRILELMDNLDYYYIEKGLNTKFNHFPQTIQTLKTLSSLSRCNSIGASITVFENYFEYNIEGHEKDIKEFSKMVITG